MLPIHIAEIVKHLAQAEETPEAHAYARALGSLTQMDRHAVDRMIASYHLNGGKDPWEGVGSLVN
jgi:hypothetical protein